MIILYWGPGSISFTVEEERAVAGLYSLSLSNHNFPRAPSRFRLTVEEERAVADSYSLPLFNPLSQRPLPPHRSFSQAVEVEYTL